MIQRTGIISAMLSYGLPILVMTILSFSEAFTTREFAHPGKNDIFELSVIHLNDFHARFVQTSSSSGTCYEGYEDECVGGIARIFTETNRLVNERPNAIFLNAGDNFQGTLWYNVHGGNVTGTFMNMLPHDAMTVGNHEFDNGIEGIVPYLEMLNMPVVATNIDDSAEPDIQGLWEKSTIIERSGRKIGVIGVVISSMSTLSSTEGLIFLDEVETVNAEAERLKKQGVEIIILLSHCGIDIDKIMAAECPNVDLIVGGHTHTFLYSGTPPNSDVAVDEYPVVVVQGESERTVLIVQAYAYTKYLGNISVWFDGNGEVMDWEGNPILLDSSIEQDPGILAALAPWQEEVDSLALVEIGSTKVNLKNDCRYGECSIGNLITDAMVDYYADFPDNITDWTYAAVAFTNVGGIRASIEKIPGVITYGDAMLVQPFENTWDVLELKGSDIVSVLEYSVALSSSETEFVGQNFLQWSGIRVIFDLSKPVNSRVKSLKLRCRACEEPAYEDVDPDEWYRVVVNSFLVTAGDGFTMISENHRNHNIGPLDIETFVSYIEKMSPIIQGIEGRMIFQRT